MSLALLVVTAVRIEGRTKAEVAREYGVSWRWVHELVRRYDAEGEAGLAARSRRPRSSPTQTAQQVEDAIVALRKELADQGLDAGAQTIWVHLERLGLKPPSVATIWRVLSRRGFVTPQPHKRPRCSFVRFEADLPNQRWQADITHVSLADGTSADVLNLIDDHSRLAIASVASIGCKAHQVVEVFAEAATRHGEPASMLTDNGPVFNGYRRGSGGGYCAIEVELAARGITMIHSTPYHPQTCGKVERFHQTLKRYLAKQEPAADVDELQIQLDRFARYYNEVRPHRSIGRRTPAVAFAARSKAVPTAAPRRLASHHRLRRDRVDALGKLTLRHNSRLHHIGMGRRLAGTRVLLLVDDLHVRIVAEETGEMLRDFVLDPTRDYQPQGGSWNDVSRQV